MRAQKHMQYSLQECLSGFPVVEGSPPGIQFQNRHKSDLWSKIKYSRIQNLSCRGILLVVIDKHLFCTSAGRTSTTSRTLRTISAPATSTSVPRLPTLGSLRMAGQSLPSASAALSADTPLSHGVGLRGVHEVKFTRCVPGIWPVSGL